MKCPYCAEEIADGSKKCSICKENLTNTCKFCKEEIADGAIKCRHCGSMQNAAILTTPGIKVDNTLVWIVAVIPILSIILAIVMFGDKRENIDAFFALVANITLCYVDAASLKKQGYETKNLSAWLIPVYLFKRAKMLNHSLAYFAVWCVLFLLTFFM